MCASDRLATLPLRTLLALVCATGLASGAWAQSGDREQEQLKRLKLQMRQVQQEKSSLEEAQSKTAQEKAALEQALKSIQSEASSQKVSANASARKLNGLRAEVTSLKQERTDLSEQLVALQKQLDQAKTEGSAQQGKAQAAELALSSLQARHQELGQAHNTCRKDNLALVNLGKDLLARYESKGVADVLAAKEPFFQVARVTLENQATEYRSKLDAATVKP